MRKIFFLAGIVVLTIGVSACSNRQQISENKPNEITTMSSSAQTSLDLVEKYWKLIEINGQAVTAESESAKEPHITFKIEDNMVFGNGGCNSFRGVYEPGTGSNLKFPKPMAATRMMCINNMDIENQFLKIFEHITDYTVNGDTLSLNNVENTALARFVVVPE